MRRLLLVRHAPTGATHAAAFPLDEALDSRALAAAGGLAAALPRRCEVLTSPALRCRQTAAAAGLTAAVDARLGECDFGSWAGATLAEVCAADPDGARAWMRDPDAAPHGGEPLRAFAARVAGWLDEQAGRDGAALAITHGGVVKAAVVHALGAPLEAFWRIDAAPLALTELHAHDGRWTVTRVNCPMARAEGDGAGAAPPTVGGAAVVPPLVGGAAVGRPMGGGGPVAPPSSGGAALAAAAEAAR